MFSSRTPNSTHHLAARFTRHDVACRGAWPFRARAKVGGSQHAGRAAARGLATPCEVGGPLWVGCSRRIEDVEPADEERLMIVGCG